MPYVNTKLVSGRTSKQWAVRTVKNGSVVIGGVTFYPGAHPGGMNGLQWIPTLPYDGRLENSVQLFGRYDYWDKQGTRQFKPYVYLWCGEDSPAIVDGVYRWMFWYPSVEAIQEVIATATDEAVLWWWTKELEHVTECERLVQIELAGIAS